MDEDAKLKIDRLEKRITSIEEKNALVTKQDEQTNVINSLVLSSCLFLFCCFIIFIAAEQLRWGGMQSKIGNGLFIAAAILGAIFAVIQIIKVIKIYLNTRKN